MKINIEIVNAADRSADEIDRLITEIAAEVAEDVKNNSVVVGAPYSMRDGLGQIEATYEYEEA